MVEILLGLMIMYILLDIITKVLIIIYIASKVFDDEEEHKCNCNKKYLKD